MKKERKQKKIIVKKLIDSLVHSKSKSYEIITKIFYCQLKNVVKTELSLKREPFTLINSVDY